MALLTSAPLEVKAAVLQSGGVAPESLGIGPGAPNETAQLLLALLNFSQADVANEPASSDQLPGAVSKRVVRALLAALQHRDPVTVAHCRRVALVAVGLAQHLGWQGEPLKLLEIAALLHDIGKIGVPDTVLMKPARLSPDELELMATHYHIAIDVLQACGADANVLEIIAHSQTSLRNVEESPKVGSMCYQGAKILAVADAYESLCSHRPYRPARTHAETLKLMHAAKDCWFDPNILAAFERWVAQHGVPITTGGTNLDHGLPRPLQEHEVQLATELCRIFGRLTVLEDLYDGFFVIGANQKIRIWNRGIQALTCLSGETMLGKPWNPELITLLTEHGQPFPLEQRPLSRALESGRGVVEILELRRADGRTTRVEAYAVPLFDEFGNLQGAIESFRDLTRTGGRRPQEFRELKLAATRDALTAVANRGELETQLAALVHHHNQVHEPFSVIFADVDRFKLVNDTYGHQTGDKVLIEVARLLQKETYSGETVGRYGGEEFVILCPGTELDQAMRKADRFRLAIRQSPLAGIKVTSSFGVSQVETGDSVESLLRRADKALYQAKEGGRDRTCSLTNTQLLAGSPADSNADVIDPFTHISWFTLFLASDMVVYKLGGFVNEEGAVIRHVDGERVKMWLGSRNLLLYWGSTPDSQPVEIELLIGGGNKKADTRRRFDSRKVSVSVKVRPRGWVRNPEVFQARAREVVRLLKCYLAAD